MAAVPHFTTAERKPPGLTELIGRVLSETRALISDYAELAVLDARRAGIRLAWLLGSGLMVAVLVVTAWMAGIAAGIVWMWGEGISWPAAIGIAAFVNLIGAGALVWWMRHLVDELPFTALLRQLKGESPHAS
ncbi:MAG TPA: phage holin family protein [Burkholderiales bacterium]